MNERYILLITPNKTRAHQMLPQIERALSSALGIIGSRDCWMNDTTTTRPLNENASR